jgi:hypothetical protein
MEHKPGGDESLFLDDILGVQLSPDARHASVEEAVAAMQARNPEQRKLIDPTEEAQYIRDISLGVLNRLVSMDVADADILAVTLQALDTDEQPSTSLLDVASVFEQRLTRMSRTQSQTRRLALKRLASLARATFPITMAHAVRGMVPGDSTEGVAMIGSARTAIGVEAENLSATTNSALDTMVTELESTIQPPPQQ